MSRVRGKRRARGTSLDRAHRSSLILSAFMALLGVAAVGIGTYAWSQPRPGPVQVIGTNSHQIASTPHFDSGVTIFGSEEHVPAPGRDDWDCVLRQGGQTLDLDQRADVEETGTRVHHGEALVPALRVGVTEQGASITCSNPPEAGKVWVLPTDTGPRRVPLALTVAGIGCLGLAILIHPRSRGLVRFS